MENKIISPTANTCTYKYSANSTFSFTQCYLSLNITRLRVVPLSLSRSCVTRKKKKKKKKTEKKRPREILGLASRISRGHFLCHARQTKRITHDGLSERGATRSLQYNCSFLAFNSLKRIRGIEHSQSG